MIDERPILKQIKQFKRSVKSENSDYLTGYICALSAVEGMIAGEQQIDKWSPLCGNEHPKDYQAVLIAVDVGSGVHHYSVAVYTNSYGYVVYDRVATQGKIVAWMPFECYRGKNDG